MATICFPQLYRLYGAVYIKYYVAVQAVRVFRQHLRVCVYASKTNCQLYFPWVHNHRLPARPLTIITAVVVC